MMSHQESFFNYEKNIMSPTINGSQFYYEYKSNKPSVAIDIETSYWSSLHRTEHPRRLFANGIFHISNTSGMWIS